MLGPAGRIIIEEYRAAIDFKSERGIALWLSNSHFMAYIADTTCIISDDQADQIRAGKFIRMVWTMSVTFVAIAKVPMVRDDIMLTGRGAVEMNL